MTLKSHNALHNANREVLWLNDRGSTMVPSDKAVETL